jgi:hypothetical protein
VIDKDEFEIWRSSPVTRWVLEAFEQAAEDQQEAFLSRFFFGNETSPYDMGLVRGAFLGIMKLTGDELSYENVVNLHESGELQLDLNGVWTTPTHGGRQ